MNDVPCCYLVAGSYEGHIVGYRIPTAALEADVENGTADGVLHGQRIAAPCFALKAHDGCVRSVVSGGAFLATCGTDNAISVYNMRKLREQGKLRQQVRESRVAAR